ncbi:MAG TPA: hypothetical protein VF380_08135 [Solirubrobacteraceae bacterium]
MPADRSRYGLLVSALGAALLAVAVFLPWYGLSFTSSGIAFVQHAGSDFAAQYGNAQLQAATAGMHASLGSLAGQQFAAVSAHEVLKDISVLLLVLAGLALLDALLPLVRTGGVPDGAGGALGVLGAVAAVCVVYRMISPPLPEGELVALSLREGAWLALLGSLMMLAGGLWPRTRVERISEPSVETWSQLSGWTPEA